MQEKIKEFGEYLLGKRHLSKNTHRCYLSDLEYFDSFMYKRGQNCWEATTEDVQWFVDEIKDSLKSSTINRKVATLATFFQWAVQQGHITQSPIHHGFRRIRDNINLPPIQRQKRIATSEADVQSLLQNVASNDDILTQRDHLLVTLMAHYGIRASELQESQIGDVDLSRNMMSIHRKHVINAKDKTIKIDISPIRELVENYLTNRCAQLMKGSDLTLSLDMPIRDTLMFVNKHGAQISLRSIRRRIAAHAARAGVKISPTQLRHTYAINQLKRGTTLRDLKERLGHVSTGITRAYLDAIKEESEALTV